MINNPSHELREILELERKSNHLLHRILKHLHLEEEELQEIEADLAPKLATSISFKETQ